MSDTTRQDTDGFQLLGLDQFVLQVLAFRYVARDAEHALLGVDFDDPGRYLPDPQGAILMRELEFLVFDNAIFIEVLKKLKPILWVIPEFNFLGGLADDLVWQVSRQAGKALRDA